MESVEQFDLFGPQFIFESLDPEVQFCPEEGAAEAVDEEAEGSVQRHEEAGHVGEENEPERRVEAGDLFVGFNGPGLQDHLVILCDEVSQVVEGEHVLELDQVEDGSGQAADQKDDDDDEEDLALVVLVGLRLIAVA